MQELNRIRRWALAIGFESILESVAQVYNNLFLKHIIDLVN